jgi:hypothetical protein
MKTKMQENTSAQIQEVEHLFFATIGNQDVLFVKAENKEATVFALGKNLTRKLFIEFADKNKIDENKKKL